MNVGIERLIHAPPPPKLLFKGVVGFSMIAIILVGAICYVIGKDYSLGWQIIAGVMGAIVGAGCAWMVGKSVTDKR